VGEREVQQTGVGEAVTEPLGESVDRLDGLGGCVDRQGAQLMRPTT
jgi:hypothetical protein